MDVQGGFNPEDVDGFIRTQAYRLKEFNRFKRQFDVEVDTITHIKIH